MSKLKGGWPRAFGLGGNLAEKHFVVDVDIDGNVR